MILYFSTTGNSRYIADALADKLGDESICTNEFIKNNKQARFHSDRPWIFVYPVYLSTIVKVYVDFLKQAEFTGSREAYFVATCASSIGSSPNEGAAFCKAKDLAYKGTVRVQMPQNYIVMFEMTPQEEIKRRLAAALDQTDEMCRVIKSGGEFDVKMASRFEYTVTKFVEKIFNGPFTKTKHFSVSDECIGCGKCARECPVNKIEMVEKKPVWHGSCIHCMGCINGCPKAAIEYGRRTVGKERYNCAKYGTENI